jgi:hypothetical protein
MHMRMALLEARLVDAPTAEEVANLTNTLAWLQARTVKLTGDNEALRGHVSVSCDICFNI